MTRCCLLLSALAAASACATTSLEVDRQHPAHPSAATLPPPEPSKALRSDFDPAAGAPAPAHDHSQHQHDHSQHQHDHSQHQGSQPEQPDHSQHQHAPPAADGGAR